MNKTMYLTFSGLMMIAAGLILFFSEKIGIPNSKILTPAFMIFAGICSFIFSKYDKLPKIANQYHILQGLGLIIYGAIVATSVNSLKSFLMVSTYFILMYGLFEIVFAFAVMTSSYKINKGILMSRLVAGGLNLLGGFILLMATLNNEMEGLLITSLLIIIGGISLVVFARKIRVKALL
ncbi:hypothetical protein [Aquimarina algiphila]|uniref:hypothetical protein n=1 Tax=Aquimarina algiphila TaxID=2047982 RepID=UPI002330321F|nr:hypothetical protein [Aquimarina algiphila]